ncbi:type VI secretion system baseplate subunit TssE [Photobacterium damselae]|uniref:Type VI secretion system baseplate subunit TssE n=1 Tax=Photobacterium damselae TaxID=38293 RepID=A0ACD3T329_PHODM|nr:type VI secretion system baseplate subunit TssE [Photobacterium damselae]MBA5682202.1 type VI secretion system baseplate subunit TssE [Photobacterium damselae subsp. damselae]MDC4168265.1 type VI secretion system baseplate subunit TssE [Photobacterium damselae]NVH52389.1 type VI secretion system baseplate subunit TssE [Photobacterium damselae subsp. damselae]NVO81503.1 type VI secretion system baseplate subunit TssE [Photobacterium damselae subsp. damselae]RDL29063.1 lysozyme [Photobacteriu
MSYIALEDSAYGVSLFERLEADSANRTITQGPEPALVLDSIKRNISQLLNSRIGESLSAPELGLIDFNDATLGCHDLALQIKLAIRRCLERYEPRLKNIDVQFTPDDESPLNLRFHIKALVNSKALHDSVQIDLLLDTSRKYRVV